MFYLKKVKQILSVVRIENELQKQHTEQREAVEIFGVKESTFSQVIRGKPNGKTFVQKAQHQPEIDFGLRISDKKSTNVCGYNFD